MYPEGHFGLTLALASILMIPFGDTPESTYFIIIATLLASLPDIDLAWQRKGIPIHHRGPTHSILFALVCGVLSGIVMVYLYKNWVYFFIGLGAGLVGIMSHLIGDVLTYMAFKPLWPFSKKEISFGLFSAANETVNKAMVALGVLCFVIYAMQ